MRKILVSMFLLVFGLCLVGCTGPNDEKCYKLTIQNDSSNELIGIKEEYKAGEKVEVKMEYDMGVETYAFLNGELLGALNGSNSLKFDMPAKDSTLVLTYSNKKIYKVNVIDNFDLLIVPLKEYYNAGDTIQIITKFLSDPSVDVQVDGQFLEVKALEAFGYYGYEFIMPGKDVEIAILYNGLINHTCENDEHQWDEGVVDTLSSLFNPPIKYTCLLCGVAKKEPSELLEHTHNYIDGLCECGEFDITCINGVYTLELLASLNHNINEINSLIIEEEMLYVILQNNKSKKIGEFELISESNVKLSQIINIDELSFKNEESKNIVKQLLNKNSFYSIAIASIPEFAPIYVIVELNNEFYYIYMESNITGVSLVTISQLNK